MITLTLNPHDRTVLATTIERLINMLDDLEPDADLEPSLGWTDCGPDALANGLQDDREEECEDEGAQCDDEGVIDTGIGDYEALQTTFY